MTDAWTGKGDSMPRSARQPATTGETPRSAKDFVFILLLTTAVLRRPPAIWEIHLTQIATATGDENLAGDGVTHIGDRSRRETSGSRSG
jgi:hypothetical protein